VKKRCATCLGRVCPRSGPKGIRTPDLLAASQTLYQLSYGPSFVQVSGLRLLAGRLYTAPTASMEQSMTTETVPPSSTAASIGSVALLAESWRLSLEAANRSPKTINTYTTGLELFSRFLIERGMPTEVSSIIREHVESSQKWMFDEGYRPASVRNRHQALQAFFKWALEDGEISASPMVNIPPPQVPEAPPAVLSEDDVAALLNTCEGKGFEDRRDLAIIRIFYSVGLRLSELSNLTIDDVDLRDKTLKVLGKGRRPRMVGYGMKVAQAIDT
jgi:hypothetical protein